MCYSLWYNALTKLPAGSLETEFRSYRLATSWVHYTTSCNTQSSVPEDGQDHRPKHVELIGNINKPLLLHLFGCRCYFWRDFEKYSYINFPEDLSRGSRVVHEDGRTDVRQT